MEKLSVVIITHNDAQNIERCLVSVTGIADEILILDSFCEDQTVAIAQKFGARVIQESFKGEISQRNRALELASHPLLLSLEANEEIDATLRTAIQGCKEKHAYSGYRINRCTHYMDQFIRHGGWYPDRSIRLFEKQKARWDGVDPHGKITFPGPVAIQDLPGEILRYAYATREEHQQHNDHLSSIAADSGYSAGRRTNLFYLIFHPTWTFLHSYILRTGFFNYRYGFIIAWETARYTFMTHQKLLFLQKNKGGIISDNNDTRS